MSLSVVLRAKLWRGDSSVTCHIDVMKETTEYEVEQHSTEDCSSRSVSTVPEPKSVM